jgi:hypothetical protein
MSAGEELEAAHARAARACGQLVFMIVKRRISRSTLEWCAGELEAAAAAIRRMLTSTGPSG